MADRSVDCHLVITSLGLLGFNTDEYKRDHPGIAMELPPITPSSFDRTNEPLLLCSLHFLLSRIDPDQFQYAIAGCWPFLNQNAKNEFKRVCYAALHSLQHRRVIQLDDRLPPHFWECHLALSAPEIWKLLRILTDACLDIEIDKMKPRQHAPQHGTFTFGGENSLRSAMQDETNYTQAAPSVHNSISEGEVAGRPTSVPVKRRSIVQQQSDALHVLSKIDSFIVRTATPEEAISPVSTRTQFLIYLDEEQRKVEELMTLYIARHNRIRRYMGELDTRLKVARAAIDRAHRRIDSSTPGGEVYALTEAGRKARVTKLERLHATLSLFEDLAHSPVLQQVAERLANTTQSGQTPVLPSTPVKAAAVADDDVTKTTTTAVSEIGGSPPASPRSPRQIQRDSTHFEVRVEAGKEELLQQASLFYAIESLVKRVQRVNAMFQAK